MSFDLKKELDEFFKNNPTLIRSAKSEAMAIDCITSKIGFNADNFDSDLPRVTESNFVNFFIPTLVRKSLQDKKSLLKNHIGNWQTEFFVVDAEDKVIFKCPSLMKPIEISSTVKLDNEEVKTGELIINGFAQARLLDNISRASEADKLYGEIEKALSSADKTDSSWNEKWLMVFERYRSLIERIIAAHPEDFEDGNFLNATGKLNINEGIDLDEYEP